VDGVPGQQVKNENEQGRRAGRYSKSRDGCIMTEGDGDKNSQGSTRPVGGVSKRWKI
jgi:hypothetical protein